MSNLPLNPIEIAEVKPNNFKIAFLTEMQFTGTIPGDFPNMRTEFAWMHALNATHIPLSQYPAVSGYDFVFVIFPKGKTFLSAEGSALVTQPNPVSGLLAEPVVPTLKRTNGKVFYVQEGPTWWYNDYELADQIHFVNMLQECDGVFAHNVVDIHYYRGLLLHERVWIIPTLMIEDLIEHIEPKPENQVIIGGNMARWYGGFESMMVARKFDLPISVQTSHASRAGEEQLVHCLPRMSWFEWMNQLSTFKYAVHLMPTVAAGTFALNCAYFGIPCIGNISVDTQRHCFPRTSVEVWDLQKAAALAERLKDPVFYDKVSSEAKTNYKDFHEDVFSRIMLYHLT